MTRLATPGAVLDRLAQHRGALRGGTLALMVLAFVGASSARGLGVGLLVLAGCMLLLAIGLMWTSVQSLTGEAPLSLEEALDMGAPSTEEEQKRAVLRALKDLDYERSVGKISEEDYAELSARYRQQAKELLRSMDESLAGARERALALVEKRLGGAPPKKKKKRAAEKASPIEATPNVPAAAAVQAEAVEEPKRVADEDEDEDLGEPSERPTTGPTRRCLECEVRNELDARFCKRCGKAMAPEGQYACQSCPARFDDKLEACPDCGVERTEL